MAHWCERRLAGWEAPHASLYLDITPSAASLEEAGLRGLPAEATGPVRTHVLVRAAAHDPGDVPLDEQRPDVVVVPDAGWCAATVTAAADALSSLGTVWVVDVPGQPGLSSPLRPRRGAIAWTTAWLDALVEASGAQDLLLVGHAAGALAVLGSRAEAIGARVLVGPGGLVPVRVGPRMTRDSARWLMRATPATSQALARHLVGQEPDEDVVDWLTVAGRSCRSQSHSRPLPRFVLERAATRPLLVLVGEEDCYLSAATVAAALARRADEGARVEELAGVGHLPTAAGWALVADRARLLPVAPEGGRAATG